MMTNERAKKILFNQWQAFLENYIDYGEVSEAYKLAIKFLEQKPCEDCISREAAICLADELKDDLPDDDRLSDMVMSHNEGVLEYQTKLSLLSSVLPKQRTGRWIDADGDNAICGCCNRLNHLYGDYCKHCGAKMQEVEG